jgi:outer membrane protein assembly factor BamB
MTLSLLAMLFTAPALGESFDEPPIFQWSTRLPGKVLNLASHTEHTRPVVAGMNVYVGAAGGKALYAVSRSNGTLITTYPAAASVESAAVVSGDNVYFADTAGVVWCYTISGDLVWKYASSAPITATPTLHEELIVIANVDDLIVGINSTNGEMQWRYAHKPDLSREAELSFYAAPSALISEEVTVAGFSDGAVVALDTDTGDVRWSRRVGEGRYPDILASPVQVNDAIIAGGYFTPFVALDAVNQTVRWRVDIGAAQAPFVDNTTAEPTLLHPGTDGKLRAINAVTGDILWTWDSGTDGALTTPTRTDSGVLVSSSEGGVYLIDDNGTEIWRYHEHIQLVGVTGAPTVSGRQLLFVTNAGNLVSMVSPR